MHTGEGFPTNHLQKLWPRQGYDSNSRLVSLSFYSLMQFICKSLTCPVMLSASHRHPDRNRTRDLQGGGATLNPLATPAGQRSLWNLKNLNI